MFSEDNTNLDHIDFRNTANVETFEAVVAEVAPNGRLGRANGEYIASNEMELLTSAYKRSFVEGEQQYLIKYSNGHNGYPTLDDYIESELRMTPIAVSYLCQIIVCLVNPSSAFIANGALHGFAGSAFMASGEPNAGFIVTHQLKLNRLTITNEGTPDDPDDLERGTIESPLFVTFGPPLNRPERQYTFDLSVILRDGVEVNHTFNVTDQIEKAICEILDYRENFGEIHFNLIIPIEIFIELPKVEPDTPGGEIVNIKPWGDDEIITVKIH
jgi:hypothetical protein